MSDKRSIVFSLILACLLALVAGPAAALGLGQIRVQSQIDQPLLAEIPIISSDPGELERLQVGLASPETFRRIGLEPPQGVVSGLQFTVALDGQGNPVVRVTSAEPVAQLLLTFLIEVDWGQGRLVREYSALLDTPTAAAAPVQAPIQAPVPAPDSTIVRTPPPPAGIAVEPLPSEPVPLPEPPPVAATPAPEPEPVETPAPAPVVATPTPTPAVPQAPATPVDATADEYAVRRGQTLSEIAASLGLAGGHTLDQTMLALLRANPDAFIDNNINLVKAGAVLRMPEQTELARLDRMQAAAAVRAQVLSWRESRRPPPQPVLADATVADTAGEDTQDAPAATGAASGRADARLEIVPPSGGDTPGTRSGVSAGGEGEMLRTQALQEELISRDAEVEELRVQVAELEELQQNQQQLIALKDSELAAVQQRLAEARANTDAATIAGPQPDANEQASAAPWLLGGVLLLVLGAIAWLLMRRRRAATAAPAPTRRYGTAALAAGMPAAASPQATRTTKPDPVPDPPPAAPSAAPPASTPKPVPESTPAPVPAPVAAPASPAATAPTWHADDKILDDAPATAGAEKPATRDGIALARAYMDLGDEEAARGLLREVMLNRDPAVRAEAARMLRELD